MTNRPPPDDFSLEETKIMGDRLTSTNDLAEQTQYLYVRVVKAIDLSAKYGFCDPYAEVRLGNYKGTTRHIEKEANPEWNQVFAFSRDGIKSNMLEVNVMDKDIIKDNFMGRVVFDLTAVPKRVPSDSPLAPEWYGLEDRTGMKVKGEIMVAVWWGSQADKLNSTNDLAEQTQYLYVRVVKAIDLSAKYGFCDPYAEVRLGNYKGTTRHIEKEANPEWNQVFAFSRDGIKSNMLQVNVMDKDILKDDFMGRVVFDLTAIPKRVPADSPLAPEWYGLEDRTGMKVKGEIMIAVWWGSQADKLTSTNDLAEQTQYLYVRVVKAIDLSAKYGFCDPYAEVRLGNYKGRTRHIEKEANPEWNQMFAFSRDGIKSNMLKVNVMDKDILKDDFMGRVVFDLTAIPKRVPADSPLAPEWYGLEDRTGMKVKGEIMIAVWWGSQADKLTSTNDLAEQTQYLYVRVVKAIDLSAKYGFCDPYAEVRLGNYKGRTRHIEKEANPEWNQVFAFSRDCIKSNMLKVNVMDKDILKDDFMGRVVFDLTAIPKRVPADSPLAPEWYGLEDRTGMKVNGEIMVAVWWGTQADEVFPKAWHNNGA